MNATYNLAFMRENGYGCTKDINKAFELYQVAASQHEPDLQCMCGLLMLDKHFAGRNLVSNFVIRIGILFL